MTEAAHEQLHSKTQQQQNDYSFKYFTLLYTF